MTSPDSVAEEFTFPVEAGHLLQFARAIGQDEAADCSTCGSPLAPPTFVAASEHFRPHSRLRPQPGSHWRGSGSGPGIASPDGAAGALHAEQHYEYHRPLHAGQQLTVRDGGTRRWQRTSSRSGQLTFAERTTLYLDEDGDPVITERRITVTVGKSGGHR